MTINHNDFMPESGRLRADIGHALERIAGIVGEVDAGSCGESLHALGVMADRDGRIASMLAHPAWKEG